MDLHLHGQNVKTGMHQKFRLLNQRLDSCILSNIIIESINSLVNRLWEITMSCTLQDLNKEFHLVKYAYFTFTLLILESSLCVYIAF